MQKAVATTISETNFSFPGQTSFARGSVRDIYTISDKLLVMVVTDRISAFDCILPVLVPHKGQVLAQIASHFLNETKDIIPNWLIDTPDPNVVIGHKCVPYKIEVVVRGYLTGHAWREYHEGKRRLSGAVMAEGLRENDQFPEPIITPATHAEVGHDEDISKADIIARGIIPADRYEQIESAALKLFERGTKLASKHGLILVDTKYEFGLLGDELVLMDEVHTPDSSRYFYADTYDERQRRGQKQRQLSKEFVREWLMEHGFQGQAGQPIPTIPDSFVRQISDRYIELYESLTGQIFSPPDPAIDPNERIKYSVENALVKLS